MPYISGHVTEDHGLLASIPPGHQWSGHVTLSASLLPQVGTNDATSLIASIDAHGEGSLPGDGNVLTCITLAQYPGARETASGHLYAADLYVEATTHPVEIRLHLPHPAVGSATLAGLMQ